MSRSRFDHVPAGAQLLSSFSSVQVFEFSLSFSPLTDTLKRSLTLVAMAETLGDSAKLSKTSFLLYHKIPPWQRELLFIFTSVLCYANRPSIRFV